jgi:hypothetical protein
MLRWLASLWSVVLFVPTLYAQSISSSGGDANRAPALPYAVAVLFVIVVMVLLCTPARKHLRK